MSPSPPRPEELHHHSRPMAGRNPDEHHRVATPLELLFDLTFVAAFGLASSQVAHSLAEGHFLAGLTGFAFASFAICWAWINFSWFASAYDTDDWIFRLVTMVQMIGVLVLAIGLPRMFASIEHGEHFDNSVMVAGYVIMRVAMVFQWLRAARQDPARRHACLTYATAISVAQLGWVALIFAPVPLGVTLAISIVLILVEFAGPAIAERQDGGTPWHAHHIAERHGLFAIIALGEGVMGTLATLSAVTEAQGWSMDAALVCVAGIGLTLGIWWVYYMVPSAAILCWHRERVFVWGYGQMVIVASIVALGAGLHVAAYYIEHKAHIGALATVLTVAVPVSTCLIGFYALYTYMVARLDPFHLWLLAGTAAVIALAVAAAVAGVGMAWCLVILTFAPLVTVIGYELLGYRHQAEALAAENPRVEPTD
ncbi:low temperature requirement protein A [Sphingomonas sp.]|uniref:low temperature requirement protein A n=1 Tax=Sphingomonas sp. TaxID=28214 RepID=UPI001B1B19B1|nr:low temperature requirement protein A [Sphingomonas sp.]MBO9713827.1 low temperature requirement protein A [Sphingomonas sp.]